MICYKRSFLKIISSAYKEATHIVFLNNGYVRLALDLTHPIMKIFAIKFIKGYAFKSKILKIIIRSLPVRFITKFDKRWVLPAKIYLDEKILNEALDFFDRKKLVGYNILVGTQTDPRHKVIVQMIFFEKLKGYSEYYLKIGDNKSIELIQKEYNILKAIRNNYIASNIILPEPLLLIQGKHFVGAVYSSINGKRHPLRLLDKTISAIKNLSTVYPCPNGSSFSHGDFAPWNLLVSDEGIGILDLEYSDCRFREYDIIHFIFQVMNLIKKVPPLKALEVAVEKSIEIYGSTRSKRWLMSNYIIERMKIFGQESVDKELLSIIQ